MPSVHPVASPSNTPEPRTHYEWRVTLPAQYSAVDQCKFDDNSDAELGEQPKLKPKPQKQSSSQNLEKRSSRLQLIIHVLYYCNVLLNMCLSHRICAAGPKNALILP